MSTDVRVPARSFVRTLLAVLLCVVQVIDAVLHIATDQAEPTRIISNVIVVVGALYVLSTGPARTQVLMVSLVVYVVINIIFVIVEGPTGPTGSVRVALFAFVASTIVVGAVLSIVSAREQRNSSGALPR